MCHPESRRATWVVAHQKVWTLRYVLTMRPFSFMRPEIIEESDPGMSYEQGAPQLAALDDHINLSDDSVLAEQGDDNASENEGDDGGMS